MEPKIIQQKRSNKKQETIDKQAIKETIDKQYTRVISYKYLVLFRHFP